MITHVYNVYNFVYMYVGCTLPFLLAMLLISQMPRVSSTKHRTRPHSFPTCLWPDEPGPKDFVLRFHLIQIVT